MITMLCVGDGVPDAPCWYPAREIAHKKGRCRKVATPVKET